MRFVRGTGMRVWIVLLRTCTNFVVLSFNPCLFGPFTDEEKGGGGCVMSIAGDGLPGDEHFSMQGRCPG